MEDNLSTIKSSLPRLVAGLSWICSTPPLTNRAENQSSRRQHGFHCLTPALIISHKLTMPNIRRNAHPTRTGKTTLSVC
jgi:hypothetical protein